MSAPRIKTTVVGSYPFPDWLGALPSEQAVIDATRVVLHTQEQAGIDLVCDGEIYRLDVQPSETQRLTLSLRREPSRDQRHDRILREADGGRAFRRDVRGAGRLPRAARDQIPHAPAGCGRGPDRARPARSAAGLRARETADRPAVQVHADRPAYAGEDALRHSLQEPARPDDGDRRRARRAS